MALHNKHALSELDDRDIDALNFPLKSHRISPRCSSERAEAEASLYVIECFVNCGKYGDVFLVRRRTDMRLLAAKFIDISRIRSDERRTVAQEIRSLAAIEHFACVGIVDVFTDCDSLAVVIILEFMDAGDLSRQIAQKKRAGARFREQEIEYMFVQLVMGLDHVHAKHILHRDIKSSNTLVSTTGLLKIGDFGLSKQFDVGGPSSTTVPPIAAAFVEADSGSRRLRMSTPLHLPSTSSIACTFLGTPLYLAPEIWRRQRYGKAADVWALGVLMYEISELEYPFFGPTSDDVEYLVLETQPNVPSHCSSAMGDMILRLLDKDPRLRPTTRQIIASPLFQDALGRFTNAVTNNERIPMEDRQKIVAKAQEHSLRAHLASSPLLPEPDTEKEAGDLNTKNTINLTEAS